MFYNYETEKVTRKASDAAENLQLYRVVRFFHLRSSCTMAHLMLFSERLPIYASCMMISGIRTEQHVIIDFGDHVCNLQSIRIRRHSLSILTE